ncbi:MAG TPA: DUF1415 domain-containing protein [Gammaproteobacteria bacterium]|nr:DUF1415 domain-containing protein [Gammaproteobacteria bacterium]
MLSNELIINTTKNWLDSFVIGHRICPFAKKERDRGSIHFSVTQDADLALQLEALMLSCEQLDSESKIETVLHIYPNGLIDFDDYLDFLELATTLMHEQGYEGIFQLASFHPDYQFQGVDADDASHYTNRSPFPMLHLLRETSLEKALASYPHPETIPQRNIDYTRKLGLVKLQRILAQCDSRSKTG